MLSKIFHSPFVRVPVRYGAIAAILCVGFVISIYYLGTHPLLINPYLDFRVPVFILLLFFSLKEIRDFYREGILYFAQGMIACFVFTFVFALIAGVLIWLICLLHPAFLSSYISGATEQIKSIPPDIIERIGKEELERNIKALPATNGVVLAIDYFGKSFIISFFISVIISVILRRQPKPE